MFHDHELDLIHRVPIDDVVRLAADLDILVPAEIDRVALIGLCVFAIVDRGFREGLPFSKYDREDLEALSEDDLLALGRIQGIQGKITVDAVLKVGDKVYRSYLSTQPDSPVALLLPTLLTAIARASRGKAR